MIRGIVIKTVRPWRYFLKSIIMDDFYEVKEIEFFIVAGNGQSSLRVFCDPRNINRQFLFNNKKELIGYRER